TNYSPELQKRFRSVKDIGEVERLAEAYIFALRNGKQEEQGWNAPPKGYQVSKALVSALTVVLAKENPYVAINYYCPGWVDTDMGHQGGKPPKTLEEGARIPVRLYIGQLDPDGDVDGKLGVEKTGKIIGRHYGNDGITERGWGKARKW
ncbi:hypothetical protein EJ02DRAFT_353273, partial [Clathrospora elynae]